MKFRSKKKFIETSTERDNNGENNDHTQTSKIEPKIESKSLNRVIAQTVIVIMCGLSALWLVKVVHDNSLPHSVSVPVAVGGLLTAGSLLLGISYLLVSHDDLTPAPGGRIPHATGCSTASALGSMGIALFGVALHILKQDRDKDPKQIMYEVTSSELPFEVYFFRQAFYTHVSVTTICGGGWAAASYHSPCLAWLGGWMCSMGFGANIAIRVCVHLMKDYYAAEKMIGWYLHASMTFSVALGAGWLIIHQDDTGVARCPTDHDDGAVADTWVILSKLIPLISLQMGIGNGYNLCGSSMMTKQILPMTQLGAVNGIIVLAASEHKAISISLFFLSGTITCSYYIGYQLGNWLLQQQYDRAEPHSISNETNVEVDGDLESATDIGPGSETEAKHEGVQGAKVSEVLRLRTQLKLLEQKLTATKEEKQCVVCMNEIARVMFVPCRHMKCCVRCVLNIEQSTTHNRIRCPMCMADVQDWMEAFT